MGFRRELGGADQFTGSHIDDGIGVEVGVFDKCKKTEIGG
jgi:hypothetical protein